MKSETENPKKQNGAQTTCRAVENEAYLGTLCELIAGGKEVPLTVCGHSMEPFLFHGRDSVLLGPARKKPRRGDVVLYRRTNGMYVLHRIVGTGRDGTYVLCGDAQDILETGIRREQILARVCAVKQKDRVRRPGSPLWFLFAQVWSRLIPYRRMILKGYNRLRGRG